MSQFTRFLKEVISDWEMDVTGILPLDIIISYFVITIIGLIAQIFVLPIVLYTTLELLFVWLFKLCFKDVMARKEGKKIFNKVDKIMNDYESKTLLRPETPYKLTNYDHDYLHSTQSLESFILSFFYIYNNQYYTYTTDKSYVCDMGRRRSLGDLYLICKNYYPECHLKDVAKIVIKLLESRKLYGCYCTTIRKYVFHIQTETYLPDHPVEYNPELRWRDVVNYYKLLK